MERSGSAEWQTTESGERGTVAHYRVGRELDGTGAQCSRRFQSSADVGASGKQNRILFSEDN